MDGTPGGGRPGRWMGRAAGGPGPGIAPGSMAPRQGFAGVPRGGAAFAAVPASPAEEWLVPRPACGQGPVGSVAAEPRVADRPSGEAAASIMAAAEQAAAGRAAAKRPNTRWKIVSTCLR